MKAETILIVEDDQDISGILALYVKNDGYKAIQAMTLHDAMEAVKEHEPDLILLDVNLPDGNGFDFAKEVRKIAETIIIFITVKDSIDDKLEGFDSGADDYLTKPFIPKEVIARIRANLKRRQQSKPSVIEIGDITINVQEAMVYKAGEIVNLFTKEKQLLFYLVERANMVISTEQLIDNIWGYDDVVDIKTVSVHISTLRKKIENNPSKPEIIQTIRGFGYKFVLHDK
ncbi:response regulator transcription factor [Lysinibacillus sp. 54212]|uniref:response regulator transcription factor n=1 Tax=Lysinibacillus sp. 54212 TaxID=3119829 RepID=UPI002FCBBAD9